MIIDKLVIYIATSQGDAYNVPFKGRVASN
jgi:hypothetical protein